MVSQRCFADRRSGGLQLGHAIAQLSLPAPRLVLGLARGGVAVALEVARALRAPLDVMVIRKIGMPGEPEFAIGAIAAPDIMIRDPIAAAQLCTHALSFEQLVQLERPELERRERLYRGSRGALDLRGKTIILVDDGLATGASMLAAVRAARSAGAAHILAAAPIASQEALARLRDEVQALVALRVAAGLMAVGDWYDDFEQLTDAAVGALLAGYLSNTG